MARQFPWFFPRRSSSVLVAHVASTKDLQRALYERWYRLRPCRAVDDLGDLRDFRYLALYEAGDDDARPYRIRHYARIRHVDVRHRRDLIPDEPQHERADLAYPLLRLDRPKRLRRTLYSRMNREVRFLKTDWNHFKSAREWNDLYLGSPLERRLHEALRHEGLFAEREFRANCRDLDRMRTFFLDFALFCRDGRLDIEVDGDTYHLQPERVLRDKERDNLLVANRWSVLRFHTAEIQFNLRGALARIGAAANARGGLAPNHPQRG